MALPASRSPAQGRVMLEALHEDAGRHGTSFGVPPQLCDEQVVDLYHSRNFTKFTDLLGESESFEWVANSNVWCALAERLELTPSSKSPEESARFYLKHVTRELLSAKVAYDGATHTTIFGEQLPFNELWHLDSTGSLEHDNAHLDSEPQVRDNVGPCGSTNPGWSTPSRSVVVPDL